MDGQQFDQYVQALGRAVGRRGVLAGLGGLVTAGISEVAAKNKHKNQHRKRKGDKAHQQKGGGNGKTASCEQLHKTAWCHCQPQKHCNVICIDFSATEPPWDPEQYAAHGGHIDDYICGDGSDCQHAAKGERCGLTCGAMAGPFTQYFETNTNGWFTRDNKLPLQRVQAGTQDAQGIPADSETWFAMLPQDSVQAGNFTRWGRYSSIFTPYTTEVAIYLDPKYLGQSPQLLANDTRFDYTSAINDPTCVHRRDFVFNVGYYTDGPFEGSYGSGPRFVMSGGNNAADPNNTNAYPRNPGHDPFTITTGGWYTFRHVFRELGDGTLAVDLILLDASGTTDIHKWTRNDTSDIIDPAKGTVTVGGNRYGWFPLQNFPSLAIDTSERKVP